ncbi:hypothetical protein ACFL30_01195 [Candidatus Latescibacterota bacterium]
MRKLIIAIFLVTLAFPAHSQETKTLFGTETDVGFVWGIETKSTDIKGDIGTTIGFLGGALLIMLILSESLLVQICLIRMLTTATWEFLPNILISRKT